MTVVVVLCSEAGSYITGQNIFAGWWPRLPGCALMASLAISKPAPRFGSMQPIMEALRPQLRPLAFFMPAFVLVAAVSFLPLGYAIVQSFFRADYLDLGTFTGLAQLRRFPVPQSGIEAIVNSLLLHGRIGGGRRASRLHTRHLPRTSRSRFVDSSARS